MLLNSNIFLKSYMLLLTRLYIIDDFDDFVSGLPHELRSVKGYLYLSILVLVI